MASMFHLTEPALIIAAALSVQSPYTRRMDYDSDVTSLRRTLESDHGDPFTLLKAYDEWLQAKSREGSTRKWCKRRGLEEQRFYEMSKLKKQFEELLQVKYVLCCVVLCCLVVCRLVLCCVVLSCLAFCCVVLCCAVFCFVVLSCAVLCCAVLCCVLLCCCVVLICIVVSCQCFGLFCVILYYFIQYLLC